MALLQGRAVVIIEFKSNCLSGSVSGALLIQFSFQTKEAPAAFVLTPPEVVTVDLYFRIPKNRINNHVIVPE